jgi:hypothetical protein
MEKVGSVKVLTKNLCECFCKFAEVCLPPCDGNTPPTKTTGPGEENPVVEEAAKIVKEAVKAAIRGETDPWVWGGPLLLIGIVLLLSLALRVWVMCRGNRSGGCMPTRIPRLQPTAPPYNDVGNDSDVSMTSFGRRGSPPATRAKRGEHSKK